ncbi:TIGR03086 family metal-binding protein [Actinomadura parmotrematis]|uniref:TIGR03086 family protein n=1 Tax=Actinomadura parmotrematis TaxID=2864039 RepID=A0ABS7FQK1_9ACTN|nr:TIGR03086 family metal-binding protein [Actinomadura parmotrematis]MBW8482004.1 TIGR03086 family protein [Actinomadura parmotrematis]
MTETHDFGPAARRVAALLAAVPDAALPGPTPCPDYTLGDLVDHIGGLSVGLAVTARKEPAQSPPPGDASRLPDGWRADFADRLDGLAAAWRDPASRTGMTTAGGLELPAGVAAMVTLNELVVHGWDVARAAGLPYEPGADDVAACLEHMRAFSGDDRPAGTPFGPVVKVPADASALDELVGLNGRDPGWSPA